MAFATEAQNEEHASSGRKRKAADDLSQEEQCRKEEQSARDVWTLRQAERIIRLYNQLGSRWKTSPLFLQRTLCYNSKRWLSSLPKNVSLWRKADSPPLVAPRAAPPPNSNGHNHTENGNGNVQGQAPLCNRPDGQGLVQWELEVTASVWSPPRGGEQLAQIREKLDWEGGAPYLPIFVGFSSPGPLPQDGSSLIVPVDCFYAGRVSLLAGDGGQQIVVKLQGHSSTLPKGKLFCIVWDNPEDIRMLRGRSVPGNGRIPPLDGVPPSGSGMWCQAIIPTKATLPSAATPVLRQSTIVCLSKTDLFGQRYVRVQSSPNEAITAVLRMKMQLRPLSRAPGQQNGSPLPSNLSASRPPPSSANELLGFSVGDKKTGHHLRQGEPPRPGAKSEVVSGLRCPLCWRHSRSYRGLQLHLRGVHDRFDYTFHECGEHPAVLASVPSFDPSEACSSKVDECNSHKAAHDGDYVYWSRAWSSPERAFLLLTRRQETDRQIREQQRRDKEEEKARALSKEGRKPLGHQESAPPEAQATRKGEEAHAMRKIVDANGATKMPLPNTNGGVAAGDLANGEDHKPGRRAEEGPRGPLDVGDRWASGLTHEMARCIEAAESSEGASGQWDRAGSPSATSDGPKLALEGRINGDGRVERARRRLEERYSESSEWRERSASEQQQSRFGFVPRSPSVGPASSAGDSGPAVGQRIARRASEEGTVVASGSSGGRAMFGAEDGTLAVRPSPSKKKGGSKAKRKPMDEDRNMENLTKRTFYHSRTGMPMDLDDVLSSRDSEDEVDEEELQQVDLKMLNDFTDVTPVEKLMMFRWNCFAREQRIGADAHMPWASRAFAHMHKEEIGSDPTCRRVFMLMLIKFWNCALISADDLDECLKVVDSVN